MVTTYYAPPVYAPAPVTTTYYRYGLLGRRGVAVTSYASPAPVVTYPAPPVVTYYGTPSVTTYYAPRRTVTYYPTPTFYPW